MRGSWLAQGMFHPLCMLACLLHQRACCIHLWWHVMHPLHACAAAADCKPGNVLLTADWRAKVTDLGTSRLLRGTSTAQVAATLAYAGARRRLVPLLPLLLGPLLLPHLLLPRLLMLAVPGTPSPSAQPQASPWDRSLAAPEQLLNGRVSLASDAYSLGLALYDICW